MLKILHDGDSQPVGRPQCVIDPNGRLESGIGGEEEVEDREESDVGFAGGKSHIMSMFNHFEQPTFYLVWISVYLPKIE